MDHCTSRGTSMAYGNRPYSSRETGTSFPQLECWSPITKTATFAAQVDGRRVICHLAATLLLRRYPECAPDPMRALTEHRAAIQSAALRIIERGGYEPDGTVVVRESDL